MALSIGSFVIFILMLGVLVIVHELGHFLTSKWLGVPVEEFGLGFPPRLLGAVKDDADQWHVFRGQKAPKLEGQSTTHTIYSLNWIPVGGFVRPAGEDNPSVPGGLAAAPKRVRLVVLAAGVTANLIFAFCIFTVGYMLGWPQPMDKGVQILAVAAGSPAEAAGLKTGDTITRLDGQALTPSEFISYTRSHLGQPIALDVERKGQSQALTVTPRTQWPEGQGPMGVSIGTAIALVSYPLPTAAYNAGLEIAFQIDQLAHLPGRLLRNEIPAAQARPVGPVGMYDLTRMQVEASQQAQAPYPILGLFGLISIALAVTNILPLPALDGGRIVFVLIEAVRGRRIDPAYEGMVHMAGLVALLILMLVITYQDIFNPLIPR